MQAFKLVKKITDKYSDLVGAKISEGADGDVYHMKNGDGKVIKFSVHYLWNGEDENKVIFSKLQGFSQVQSSSNLFASLYQYEYIGNGIRDTANGKQKYLLFSCIMEKCIKITEDEAKVFHSLISHEDNNLEKKYPLPKIKEMLYGMSMGLDFSEKEVLSFIEKIYSSPIKYTDLHPRNIMKNSQNQFRLIDFDRIDM